MSPIWILAYTITVFALAAAGVAFVKGWARKQRVLDIPSQRSSHNQPTPRGGGLVIVVLTTAAWLFLARTLFPSETKAILFCVAGGLVVAVVSLLDDLKSLQWTTRMAAHILAAALLIVGMWPLPQFGSLPAVMTAAVMLVWVVGLINAYNFMDGIDGIAAGQAIVAGLGWAVLGSVVHQPMLRTIGVTIAAVSGGFLVHNFPPASIFMGDVGAAFLGFNFAALPLLASRHDLPLAAAGPLLVWPFLGDTVFTFFRRLLRHENVVAAHRSHVYQRLVTSGMSHGQVSLTYSLMALLGAGPAFAIARGEWMFAAEWLIVILGIALTVYAILVRREAKQRNAIVRPLDANDLSS